MVRAGLKYANRTQTFPAAKILLAFCRMDAGHYGGERGTWQEKNGDAGARHTGSAAAYPCIHVHPCPWMRIHARGATRTSARAGMDSGPLSGYL